MAHIERILLIVAVVALGWYATARAGSMLYQASQNRQLEQMRLERADLHLPPLAPSESSASSESSESSSSPAQPRSRRSPALVSNSGAAPGLLGRIDIPRLGISAIVREGIDDRTLRRAVGHLPETALPGDTGNMALAAHRDTYFGALQWIRAGDPIRLRTPDGDFAYVVLDTRVVEPTDVSVLAPTSDSTLTLITCYPFSYVGPAPQRFIVRAKALR